MKGLNDLTITIQFNGTGVSKTPARIPEPPEKADPDKKRADAFDNELITKNRMDENQKLDLTERLCKFVSEMLEAGKEDVVRYFLDKAKHHLTPDMLSLIKDDIQAYKLKNKSR